MRAPQHPLQRNEPAKLDSAARAESMKALILESPGRMSLQRVPLPEPSPGELLVRVEAATTCGTDLKAYLRGHPQIPMPGVFGHEYSGTVEARGAGAPFNVGDAIMGVHSAPCQECSWCQGGQENLCEHIMATKVLGSFAEYLLIPAHIAKLNVFTKPQSIGFEHASLLEPLSCVAQGLATLQPRSSDRILVVGPGAIGLMFVAALRHLGISDVTLAGRNKKRLAVGELLGAKSMHLSDVTSVLGRGFDSVIECTGSVEVWEASFDYVRRGGTVMLFGGCPAGSIVAVDTRRLHYDQISVVSPFHFGTASVRTARTWLLDPTFDIDVVLSETRPLEDAEQVFEDLQVGKVIKVVFKP